MYVHGTTHYNLPLTSGEDTRDWMDTNQAFEDVDAALWSAKQDAEGAKTDLTTVQEDVATLQTEAASEKTRLDTAISDITAVSTVVIQQGTDIANTKQDLEDMICPTQEPSATASVEHAEGSYFIYNDTLYKADELITVGTLIVPDSNCHTTSVTDNLGGGGGGGAVIDDTTTSTSTVWSSSKTNTEVTKARIGDTRYSSGNLQYYNGSTWTNIPIGGGNMPILDFANPLYTFPADNVQHTYTVPEGKRAVFIGSATGASATLTINGLSLKDLFDNSHNTFGNGYIPLNAGDVVIVQTATLGAVILEAQ